MYFKDLSLDNNLNADSKILHIADKICHYKTLSYLTQGEQFSQQEAPIDGKGRKKQRSRLLLDHDNQVMADL